MRKVLSKSLMRYTHINEIVGDIIKVNAEGVSFGELAFVESVDGERSYAEVVALLNDTVSLQVFAGTKGISTESTVRFLGHGRQVKCSNNILGRLFNGAGELIDRGPNLDHENQQNITNKTVNPIKRNMPSNMIETKVPMIDVFNCLVESQKIPIFAPAGEPYNALLARIGFQAEAEIVIFGGMGLIFDDYHFFKQSFEDNGILHKTVMFVNQASDAIVERLMIPDMALAVAEYFAVKQHKRVLVLLTDMTAYADAMKEINIAQEKIPATRGYSGDLYTQLARRYEKACDFSGAGSVTILSVTTMPGDDVTHPVPDNTGYITEGQFYLHDNMIDPFGSLSRLKQKVIGKATREDHGQIMNTMILLYSQAQDAARKEAMAFDLSIYDKKLLKFGQLFKQRFMNIHVAIGLTDALDLCWETLAECFDIDELLMKRSLIDRYFPNKL